MKEHEYEWVCYEVFGEDPNEDVWLAKGSTSTFEEAKREVKNYLGSRYFLIEKCGIKTRVEIFEVTRKKCPL